MGRVPPGLQMGDPLAAWKRNQDEALGGMRALRAWSEKVAADHLAWQASVLGQRATVAGNGLESLCAAVEKQATPLRLGEHVLRRRHIEAHRRITESAERMSRVFGDTPALRAAKRISEDHERWSRALLDSPAIQAARSVLRSVNVDESLEELDGDSIEPADESPAEHSVVVERRVWLDRLSITIPERHRASCICDLLEHRELLIDSGTPTWRVNMVLFRELVHVVWRRPSLMRCVASATGRAREWVTYVSGRGG